MRCKRCLEERTIPVSKLDTMERSFTSTSSLGLSAKDRLWSGDLYDKGGRL